MFFDLCGQTIYLTIDELCVIILAAVVIKMDVEWDTPLILFFELTSMLGGNEELPQGI